MMKLEYQGSIHSMPGISFGIRERSSLMRNATGMPWAFPDPEASGGLRSAWASTQIKPKSDWTRDWPITEPIPRLWSPPSVRTEWPCLKAQATLDATYAMSHA